MKERRLISLVVLVSCTHALVHLFELSIPSVELDVAKTYGVDRATTGLLSTTWRLPFGIGAFFAGWLVDHFGPRRMLSIYLFGCCATGLAVVVPLPLTALFAVMFLMGSAASIYHPAGLSLLSFETTDETRARALGLHGIFGSAGIGGAPFVAAAVLALGGSWRMLYLVLAIVAGVLGLLFLAQTKHRLVHDRHSPTRRPQTAEQLETRWSAYALLITIGTLQGFTYSAVLTFLRRFLAQMDWLSGAWAGSDAALTGAVLLVGCIGQFLAGTWARHRWLEAQLFAVIALTIPGMAWMSMARGVSQLISAALFVLFYFMHQPIYNTLVAKYTPPHRRSLAYGISFGMGLGVGGIGATFAGSMPTLAGAYLVLAGIVATSALLTLVLYAMTRKSITQERS